MPHKCCVPNCRGNYDRDGPKVSIFTFPKDEELRKIWLERIPRKNYTVTKNSKVCEKHFQREDLEYNASTWDSKTGELHTSPLKHPRLRKGALPCIFEGFPNRTKKYVKKSRLISVEEKKREREVAMKMAELRRKREKEVEEQRRFREKEKIESLDDLEEKLRDFLEDEDVQYVRRHGKLYLYRLVTDPQLRIRYSIEIDETLTTEVWLDKAKLPIMKLNNVKLVFPVTTPTLSVVQTIVKKMNGIVDDGYSPNPDTKKESAAVIKNLLNNLMNDANKDHIQFICQQVDCISRHMSSYRWSSDIITFLGFFMALFPRAYYFLMRSQRITLPSPTIVKELSHEKFTYIPKVRRHAKDDDCNVVLVINEVDVRPFSGVFKKKGYSTACVYVFSVSSLVTAFKEVIYVTPVQTDYTPSKLNGTLLKLIAELEKIGFKVVGLVSDNLPFNIEAVSLLADPPKLSIAYIHPSDDKRPLFYVIDPAHTFKCIRDDWLITPEGVMKFPNFHVPDTENLLSAKFSDLKRLIEPPPHESLIYTHSITKLALNPVFPHKRDLKLVLQLFCDNVINDLTALSLHETGETSETAQFINILTNWWKVCGFDSLDESTFEGLSTPLSLRSESYQYLETLLEWVEKWGEIIEAERNKLKETLEAQLAEKHARQAEKAAKAELAELTGAKKRKRKRPKKSADKEGETEARNEVECTSVDKETQQGRKEPPEPEMNGPDTYHPNGNANWVEQNLNTICGRMNFQVPGQTYSLTPNNGFHNSQNVYNYQQHDHHLFGTIHGGYEFNHASSSTAFYPNQSQAHYYPSCSQNYGPQQSHQTQPNRGTGNQVCGQIMDLDAQPPVTVILGDGQFINGPVEKSQPPGLLPIPKPKKPRTSKKQKQVVPEACAEGFSADNPISEKTTELVPADHQAENPRPSVPAQPPPVAIPQFAGGSRAKAPRSLRFNFVKFETFTALKHSTYALLEITKYCVKELKIKHILAGKIHVDGLQMICVDSTFTPGGDKDD